LAGCEGKNFMKLFGTDGIRGHVGKFLNAQLALEVGASAGKILRSGTHPEGGRAVGDSIRHVIVIGQDSRTSGNMLSAALTAGLTASGLDVWNLGLCPTPAVAFLAATLPEIVGGVMISASHNPPEDNGIKFFDSDGNKFSSELQAQIEALMCEGNCFSDRTTHHNWGSFQERSQLLSRYQDSIQQSISTDLKGIKVVLDLAWGSATKVSPDIFKNLGAEVICLNAQPRGELINVNCGSTHLQQLQTAVQELGADMGFAFDGDADRVLAVDGRGGVVDGDYILYLWGQELLETERLPNASIVTTVMANLGFERAWQKLGGQMVRTAVGDQYVHAEMIKSGAMLGGEQSGHVLCRHYGVSGDGLLTALHLAALVKKRSPLSDLMEQSFKPYPQLLKNVRVEDREVRRQWQTCDPLMQAIDLATNDLGDRGRVLVRASGTEPLIRVMVEAETMGLAQHWTDRLSQIIQQHLVK
jgi:phosphoglucosamine mutase